MGDHHDYPFKAEYAKSNRASCKGCKGLIGKDTLRLAIMVQSPVFDGKIPNWFHHQCFWKRSKVTATSDIHGYDGLRWEDQQKIKDKLGGGGGASGSGGAGDKDAYKDFKTEYAKSNRSKCRGCDDKIEKDDVRIAIKEYESERAKLYGPQDLWHHVDCFVEHRDDLEFMTDMQPASIPGYKHLQKDDQDMLIEKLGKGSASLKRKKSAASEVAAKKSKKENPEEKALREQSQLIWQVRDQLSKNVSNEALRLLLEYNGQESLRSESKLLDRVTDAMAFGTLQPCPECKNGQLVPGTTEYHCTGNLTEWTKCMYSTQEPKRKPFKVPKEYHDVDFLAKYKYVKRKKVFSQEAASATSSLVSSAASEDLPLTGMKFCLGKTASSKLNKKVESLGGKVVSKVDGKVMAVISTKEEVEKNSKLIKEAKKCDVHVITEDFLSAVSKGGAALLVKSHAICSWGSDPHDRINEVESAPKKSAYKSKMEKRNEDMYTKSMPTKVKMKLKGGAAVDPDSGLEDSAHVVEEHGVIYNAVLGLVDIARGTNSYYKLQVLESDNSKRCWLFRAWGRVGTTIGGNKLENCGTSRHSAIEQFEALYGEKTGNAWEDRHNFNKIPNKFYPLDIDYGAEDDNVKLVNLSGPSKSKLPNAVQDLVKMVFDVESMKKAMMEFEIDLKKMPLGKLSKKQIESAYKVLSELQQLTETKGSPTQFLDASNRFYTLIPHDFGMKKPPMLDTTEVIKTKTDMLNNLLEIEIAYSMLKSGDEAGEDPIDMHYKKLKTDVQVLDQSTEEFERLKTYVKNTHAATHAHYDLELLEVFKLDREGEAKRYKPFKNLGNRKLLWHGSRVTNYAGILSQGLRIAPPEAPVTGYMFGKGIYFADMVSKSANYCSASKSNPIGMLLLCDVALGGMYELTGAQYVTQLPKGKHSTKGCGRTHPDPSQTISINDVEIPMGNGIPAPVSSSSLLYNEYIVYDTAQVNMKYLLKCKFNYKALW